jgi:hypothetical protein
MTDENERFDALLKAMVSGEAPSGRKKSEPSKREPPQKLKDR